MKKAGKALLVVVVALGLFGAGIFGFHQFRSGQEGPLRRPSGNS